MPRSKKGKAKKIVGHPFIVFVSVHIPDAKDEQDAFDAWRAGEGTLLSAKVVQQPPLTIQ